jgi:hypothetical protein
MDLIYRDVAPKYTERLTSFLDKAYKYEIGYSRGSPWCPEVNDDPGSIIESWPNLPLGTHQEMLTFMEQHPNYESADDLIPKLSRLHQYESLRVNISFGPSRDQPDLEKKEWVLLSDMISASWKDIMRFYDKVLLGRMEWDVVL